MTDRAYLEEVLNQVWLIHQEMSELLVNAQKEKISGVHASSRKPTKKCAMKMKETNKQRKNNACVNIIFMEGSHL